jgi:hypothetical protein
MLQLKNLKMSHLTRAEEKQRKEEEAQRLEDEAIARGETPLSVLEKPARADYQKKVNKVIMDIPENKRNLETIAKMREIFKTYPHIGHSWIHMLDGDDQKAGFWSTLGRKFANKKELAAAQKLKKLTSSLNFGTIQDVGGKTATNMMKQIIKEASVHGRLEKEAFADIASDLEKKFSKKLTMAQKYKEGLRRKIMVSDDDVIPQGSQNPSSDLENVSTQDLMKELQALEGH